MRPVARVSRKRRSVFALAVCSAFLVPAFADAPKAAGPDPRALGLADAMLEYCTKAYPESADKYRLQVARLSRGARPETLAKLRSSDEYRSARSSEDDFVSKVDPHNAKRVCARSLAAKK